MKTKITILCCALFLGFFVLSAHGQSTVINITFKSPATTTIPSCVTRFNTEGNSTFYLVVVPDSLKPEVNGTNVEAELENNNIIFPFVLKKDGAVIYKKATCEASLTGYRIILFLADSTSDTTGGTSSGTTGGTTSGISGGVTRSAVVPATPSTPNKEANEKREDAEEDVLDLSIPESPGFTILGITPQEVTRPTKPRDFATAIINSLDRNGNFQSGIAIDTVPYLLLYGHSLTITKYREKSFTGFLRRLGARSQFSLATTKGTTESDKSARIGTGLNMTFFDSGDLDLDLTLDVCYQGVRGEIRKQAFRDIGLPEDTVSIPVNREDEFEARYEFHLNNSQSKYIKCLEAAKKRNFGRSSFGVGVAASWISKDGDSSKFTNNGQGLWASLAYGFEGTRFRCDEDEVKNEDNRCITPQLIFHFRRRVKETVPNPLLEGMFTTRDSNLFGTRLRVGVPNWAVSFEGVYRAERYAGRTSSSSIQASVGADYKLAKNLFLNFSVGGETKQSNIPNTGKVFVRTSFNWGTSQKPLIKP